MIFISQLLYHNIHQIQDRFPLVAIPLLEALSSSLGSTTSLSLSTSGDSTIRGAFFLFFLGSTTSLSLSTSGVSFITATFFFFRGCFTTSLSLWPSSDLSLIRVAFFLFHDCFTTSLSLWLSSDNSWISCLISSSEDDLFSSSLFPL